MSYIRGDSMMMMMTFSSCTILFTSQLDKSHDERSFTLNLYLVMWEVGMKVVFRIILLFNAISNNFNQHSTLSKVYLFIFDKCLYKRVYWKYTIWNWICTNFGSRKKNMCIAGHTYFVVFIDNWHAFETRKRGCFWSCD